MNHIKAKELLDSFSELQEIISENSNDPFALASIKAGLEVGYYAIEDEINEAESQDDIKLYQQLQSKINQAIIIIDSLIFEGQEE